jgi:Fe-S cluster assembly ATP-binding protein
MAWEVTALLQVEGLKVEVEGREILHGIDLAVDCGETHVLFGMNGSGKTTLLMAIMGFPRYRVTSGSIRFAGQDLSGMTVDQRARLGIGMMFQRPPTVRGIRLEQMVGLISGNDDRNMEDLARELNLADFMQRDINHGFSGGEIKRSELLQLLAQDPELVLLDEPESGVDMENMQLIGGYLRMLLQKDLHRTRDHCGLVITHTGYILDYVEADKGYVMCDGKLICSGNPREMLADIRENGFEECSRCVK